MSYYIFKYRRKVVRLNLENAFPNKTKSEIIRIEKAFYHHFSDVIFEMLKTLTINKKTVFKRLSIKNNALIMGFFEQKKDIIMYGAHYSNWEWGILLPLFLSHKTTTFYQKLSNKYINELMQLIRKRFGMLCVESKQGYKTLAKLRQDNILTINYIVGDQNPKRNSSKYWTKFLNQETAFLIGADRIAKKMNQVVVFPLFKKLKRGTYELEFILIDDNTIVAKGDEIIEKYVRVLENQIKKTPELWLWSHRRWKLRKPQE